MESTFNSTASRLKKNNELSRDEHIPLPPLAYCGGDLGLGNDGEPWIYLEDATGVRYLTHSVEWLLKQIDHFARGRNQDQLLACAAMHFGFTNCRALFGRDEDSTLRPQVEEGDADYWD